MITRPFDQIKINGEKKIEEDLKIPDPVVEEVIEKEDVVKVTAGAIEEPVVAEDDNDFVEEKEGE